MGIHFVASQLQLHPNRMVHKLDGRMDISVMCIIAHIQRMLDDGIYAA